jgi:hypothetical protein
MEDFHIGLESRSTTFDSLGSVTDFCAIEMDESYDISITPNNSIKEYSISITGISDDFNQKELIDSNVLKDKEINDQDRSCYYDINVEKRSDTLPAPNLKQVPVIQVQEYIQTDTPLIKDSHRKIHSRKKQHSVNLGKLKNFSSNNKIALSQNQISNPKNKQTSQLASREGSLYTASQEPSKNLAEEINNPASERIQPYKTVLLMILVGLLVIVNYLVTSGNKVYV